MKRPAGGRRRATRFVVLPVLITLGLALASLPRALSGQNAEDGLRVGLTLGGISTVGVVLELYRGSRSVDLTLGTFSFKDVGLALSAKQYIGSGTVRGFAGAGLWLALTSPPDQRMGAGLVARFPIGVDWRIADDHAAGLAIALNRALVVRRPDPSDDRPMNKGIVPLPGLYYRFDTGS